MKIKLKRLNKKLITAILASSLAFTNTSCSKSSKQTYSPYRSNNTIEKTIETDLECIEVKDQIKENNNEINKEFQANEDNNTNLVVTNIPEDATITLNDGTITKINTFDKKGDNSYQIPSTKFTLNFEDNGKTYSYSINAKENSTIYVTKSKAKDNEIQLNIEINNKISEKTLKDELDKANIKINIIENNKNIDQNIIERTNQTYKNQDLTYQKKSLYINNLLLNEELQEYDTISYYSPLRRGNGENNIEIIDNETVKLTYDQIYINDYKVLEHIENNINYFFNIVNKTQNINYYSKNNSDLVTLIDEETEINEHIEKYYKNNNLCQRYSYNIEGNTLVEFGQTNYDNEYYYNDPTGMINFNQIELNYENNENKESTQIEYIYTNADSTEENDNNFEKEDEQEIYEYEKDYQFTY